MDKREEIIMMYSTGQISYEDMAERLWRMIP